MSRINKVMLIFPPARISTFYDKLCCVPMGISYLAAVIRDHYQVRILDSVTTGYEQERKLSWNYFQYGLPPDDIVREVEKFSPDLAGISCTSSSQFPIVAEICEKIKKLSSEIITVTGGSHPSFLPEQSFKHAPGLDFIIIGEGEESFPALLTALDKGSGWESIDGLAWRNNGEIRVNPKTKFIENLDRIPFPARDLLPLEKYFEINVPFMFYSKSPRNLSFLTSRGCPFKCTFCTSCHYWGNRIRYRSLENVMEELRELKQRYRVEEIKFEEDNLLLNRERAKKLFRAMIEEKLNFHWNIPGGAYLMSLLDEELVSLMKQSGCFELTLPFESGNQEVLDKIMKKPLDLAKAERAVRILKDYDIDTHAVFVIGLPGETKEQIKNTFRFARKLKPDHSYCFIFNPLPGSALYQECIDKGYFDPEQVFYADFATTGITTDEFNPTLLRRWQQHHSFFQNFSLLARRPRKFFGKYLKRVARKNALIAVLRAFRTFILSRLKNH